MKTHLWLLILLSVHFFSFSQTVSYNFEDGNLGNWTQSPVSRWEISSANPIGGSLSLKHAPTSGVDIDRVSIPLPTWNGSQGAVVWRFRLRHRYNPSGTNHWAVFLTSNLDATGMIAESSPNGYAVGVNLTGTDDTLSLYKVTNGAFTTIIKSSINWEKDIGSTLNSIGAIEVERKADGTFIFKASTTSLFENLQPQGSVVDASNPFGGFFGIYYRYSTSAAGLLMVDDISFTFKEINQNDHLTVVLEPDEEDQVEGGDIGSLSTTYNTAIDVFRFKIFEQGSTDNLPTYTTKLRFEKVPTSNGVNWLETIAGVRLRSSLGEIAPLATYILPDAIELDVDKNSMVVNNNSSREFVLSVFLKQESISDGSTFRLQVSKEAHGWEADFTGSNFASTFPNNVVSNLFTIRVQPTHLTFTSVPQQVVVNQHFDVIAQATDINGNLATSFHSSEVLLSLAEGSGSLYPISELEAFAVNGVATWNNITYSGRDVFKLRASADDLQPAISNSINVTNDPTSYVTSPTQQPLGAPISSLNNTPGQAVEVFRFRVVDDGANDAVSTSVMQVFIKRPTSGTNLASFSNSIAGVVLKVGETIIPTGNPHILTASISIPIPDGALVIPDGTSKEVSVYVYLKTTGLVDGGNLQFMVDSEAHNFIAYPSGSQFTGAFPTQIVSNSFPIDVQATRLSFSTVPQHVGLEESFSVEISAVDESGNLDIDATGTVTLSKNSGEGWLTIPTPNRNLTGGKATWTGLIYYMAQPFTLLASIPSYNDVISPLIYCADKTSTILQPSEPLPDGTISTLAVDQENSVEIFRCRFTDPGNTDGLPTYITQMTFNSFGLPTDVPLNRAIQGVILTLNDQQISTESVSLSAKSISISIATGSLVVTNGSTANISLRVFLRKGGLIDGSTICLYVPAASHGWQVSPMGSAIVTAFEGSVMGPTMEISVTATTITFVNQPFTAIPSEPKHYEIAATDVYGNIDKDTQGQATLLLDYGPANINLSNQTKPFNNGVAQWNDVSFPTIGKYRLKASSFLGQSVQGFSDPVWCGGANNNFVNANFDTGYPSAFPQTGEWIVSSVSPIDGERSLKHGLSGVSGESRLPIPLSISNMGNMPLEWSFVVRTGAWDPSADNTFWFVLASDSTSIRLGDFSGYAVGVNLTGTTDLLSLWRITKGKTSQLLIQSDFDWDESETAWIRVTRTPEGEWSLWFQQKFNDSPFRLAGKSVDSNHTKVVTCGPVFKFTSSRAGELWLDNLRISGVSYPPVLRYARILNLTAIDVAFSAPVNQSDIVNISNFSIKTLQGSPIQILECHPNPDVHSLLTIRTDVLPQADMILIARNIRNSSGDLMVNDSIVFGLGSTGTFGSVIINELMARPSPVVGLPSVEFVELYNRSANPISLKDWRVRGNNNYATIPDAIIEPNGYLLLSGTSGASAMSQFGNAIGVPSFPTLLVGGMFLALYNSNNQLISWVEYSDTWYRDDSKKTGGYSLERIDPNNLVEGSRNWIASNDPTGGTPGRVNSVMASNPDETSPRVTEVKVVSPTTIEIGFSEPMDSLSITLISNYEISPSIGNPLWAFSSGPKYNKASITLSTPLEVEQLYSICFNPNITDFSGNNLLDDCKNLAIPQAPIPGDIVINEILFNPKTGGVDFVEIYNCSDKTFDLNRLWIANRNRTTLAINEYFLASDTAWLLLPKQYAVLTINPSIIEQHYYVENPSAMVWTKRLPAYPNDNGYVLLLEEFGDILDEFNYSDKMHYKLLADVKGVSLERIHPDLPTADPSTWQSAAEAAGFSTPSARNSQYQEPVAGKDVFTLSPQVFSPDGDGYDDVLLISYELPEAGYTANILIFDSRGRRVKRLASNKTLGTSGTIKWDGATDDGRRATIGAYVILIEAFDLNGRVKRYKKTCVVAAKFGG